MPGSLAGGSVAKVAKLSVVKVEIVRPSLLKPSANEDFPKDQKPRRQIGAFYISVDSRPCSAQTSFESPFLKRVRSFRECRMYRPPLRGRPAPADKKVLLIDRCQATREARTAVLRSHARAAFA